ncbi:MAG: DUF4143 domain-containing protein [Propionibacteriaceae bacterium]|nr:DUF4143 domain-containing protein [Propionibacteriaceae bacterium]
MIDSEKLEGRYRTRVIDTLVEDYLASFGGVVIEGAKWCGKTWTGREHTASSVYVDREMISGRALLDPDGLLAGARPMLVDEWQDAPVLWDVARRIIDDAGQPGQFVFTGSAVPPRSATRHSGTGRFARLRMRPMSLLESGDSTGQVSLRSLFEGATITPAVSRLSYQDVIRLICRGGWPVSVGQSDQVALRRPRAYLDEVAESDISRSDGVARNPRRVKAVLRSLARNDATFTTLTKIKEDVDGQEKTRGVISLPTLRSYCKALDRIFVIEDLPSWRFSLRSQDQLLASAKRHFVDPSLAAAALDATPATLAADPLTTGFLFETLAIRDLRVYAQALEGEVFQYHDKKGLEADAIITAPGGKWGAIEVKLGWQQEDQAAASLVRLKHKLASDAHLPPPSFLLIITGVSNAAHTRGDGIHVAPIDQLGI